MKYGGVSINQIDRILGWTKDFLRHFFQMVRKTFPHILRSVLRGRDREKVGLPPKKEVMMVICCKDEGKALSFLKVWKIPVIFTYLWRARGVGHPDML